MNRSTVPSPQTSQFCFVNVVSLNYFQTYSNFDLECKHKHKTAFRARKVTATFENQAPGRLSCFPAIMTLVHARYLLLRKSCSRSPTRFRMWSPKCNCWELWWETPLKRLDFYLSYHEGYLKYIMILYRSYNFMYIRSFYDTIENRFIFYTTTFM